MEKTEIEILHEKFCTLISASELVSAINNGGHPTLQSPDSSFPKDTSPNNPLLACADILVRNEAVAAVAVSGSRIVAMQGHSGDLEDTWATDEPDPADEEKSDDAGYEETHFREFDYSDIAAISAIVNPQPEDKDAYGYKFPNDCQCILVPKGNSHLPKKDLPPGKLCEHFIKKIK
jgi:hypothetical protein